MKEFTTIAELATAKTREEIVTWAAEMQKCPYDYEGDAFDESVCKEGADAEQCNQCWLAALKDIKCKGDEEPKKTTRKSKQQKAEEKANAEIMSHMSDPLVGGKPKEKLAAKNSNEGVKALKQLASTMTKEEFLQNIKDNKICPNMYGFPDTMANCQKHAIGSQCNDCWKTIVDAMEFKEEEEKTTESVVAADTTTPEEEKQALIAPTNDPKVLNYVDKLVEEVKKMRNQQVEWDAMLKLKIEEAKAKVEEEKQKLQRSIDFNMAQIKVSFDQLDSKETKTQKKIKVISGEVILKKAAEKLDYDKDKLLAYAKEKQLTDYIKIKEEFNWGDYKKTLNIVDGNIVDADGVVLKVDGLSVVLEEEKLEVK